MIIDIHLHPFCKEITLTPSLDDAFTEIFNEQRNPEKFEKLKSGLALLFQHNTVDNIIADIDRNGTDKACIVAMHNDDALRCGTGHQRGCRKAGERTPGSTLLKI